MCQHHVTICSWIFIVQISCLLCLEYQGRYCFQSRRCLQTLSFTHIGPPCRLPIRWICHHRRSAIVLDTELSFGPHISQLVSRCFLLLRRTKSCVRTLSMDVRKAVPVVNSFIICRADKCSSLLAWVPRYQLDWPQSVLNNTAARLIIGAKKHDHIKHLLRDRLHWLLLPQRVQFKLCLLTYKALQGLAPSYIADLCRPVTTVGSRQRLRSATHSDLVVSSSVTHFGTRAFAWNFRCTYEHGRQYC